MKGLLVVLFIGMFVFIGCSKSEKEGDEEIIGPESELPELMKQCDIIPNDTTGLRIFGVAQINNQGLAVLGRKNGHLWIQMVEPQADSLKKKYNFIVNADFNDNVEIDLGYGEKKVVKVDYVNWDDKIGGVSYLISWHDQEHFSLYKIANPDEVFSWVIFKDEIFEKQIYYYDVIANGYIGRLFPKNKDYIDYICNEKGETLYEYRNEFKDCTFINLYEYIKYSNNSILRQNAETGEVIWETRFEKMGQVIDDHEPKIEHSIKITGEYAECPFNITNYDGSKETKKYNVDIETGEIIEK